MEARVGWVGVVVLLLIPIQALGAPGQSLLGTLEAHLDAAEATADPSLAKLLRLERENLALIQRLQAHLTRGEEFDRGFGTLTLALATRGSFASDHAADAQARLAQARSLLETIRYAHHPSELAVTLARQALTVEHASFHRSPSLPVAIGELWKMHPAPLAHQAKVLREIASLPAPWQAALIDVVDAYVALQRAVFLPEGTLRVEGEASARLGLVEAAWSLQRARGHLALPSVPTTIRVSDAVLFRLDASDDTYLEPLALLVDAGGNDLYLNNAGGSCIFAWCGIPNGGIPNGAAALIDLDGADRYHSGRNGSNGGGFFGAGFLADLGGNDSYLGGTFGSNGGGAYGSGFLLDAGGNDTYHAGRMEGTNGAGTAGSGTLVDLAGDDLYEGGNGGAILGSGLLVDAEGNDQYVGLNAAGNEGAGLLVDGAGDDVYVGGNAVGAAGVGIIVDGAGDDTYRGRNGAGSAGIGVLLDFQGDDHYIGRNGGALTGAGFLVDLAGDDVFEAPEPFANGGASAGAGFLLDAAGDDQYLSRSESNGGAGVAASGFLADLGGDDLYVAAESHANGGASQGAGFLFDADGSDTYIAGSFATNGGGILGVGMLLDLGHGDDLFQAGDVATNGGGSLGAGFLVNEGGNDRYIAGTFAVNGGGAPGPTRAGFGLLLDGGGWDTYLDGQGGSGEDVTLAPKGFAGAQLDLTLP